MCLISWWGFAFALNIEYFPFLDGVSSYGWKHSRSQGSLYCTSTRRSDNFYLMHLWFIFHRKKLEEVDFVDKEFLHKKVNKNGVYMRIMVCYRRYSRRYIKAAWVNHYGDLTVLNWRRWLRYCSFVVVKPVG